ncbi:MAG TPA: hypothetical protein VJ770_11795 [Stellaceae bacterium]|nr:hypothetical protein [Stellaceae bacterium]
MPSRTAPLSLSKGSDAIAAVRREIWAHHIFCTSRSGGEIIEIPRNIWNRMADALAYAA